MTPAQFRVGAYVRGGCESRRVLADHDALLNAYADREIEDVSEAYLSHFVYGDEMRTHYRANGNSVAEFKGPCRARWLIIDIDQPDLSAALDDTRRLVQAIGGRYPELDNPPIFFSGSKGFHVLLELAHDPPPTIGFNSICKIVAEGIAFLARVKIDTCIYDVNHIVRLPNTRHPKTGLFKRRIDSEALFKLDINGILETAKHPSGDGIPVVGKPVPVLASDWREAEEMVAATSVTRAEIRRECGRFDSLAPRYFVEFLRFGANEGERHQTLFRCAAWLTEQGAPPSLCYALLTEPGRDVGLSPKDVERQISCGIEHARKQKPQTSETGDAA